MLVILSIYMYQKPQLYRVWFLKYGMRDIAPLPPNNLENQTFEKRKKLSGDVITLHMCTKSHDKMMYAS